MPTLAECLAEAISRLSRSPHPDRATLDAETLLFSALGKNRAWFLSHRDEQIPQTAADRFNAWIERRFDGEPIQYVTGETEFYGLPLRVTPDVLIPRPETEHLVEKVFELIPLFRKPRIVDVGAGSGAIAIALAHDWSGVAEITATDISFSALELARRNAERVGFVDSIRFLNGDLLTPIAGEQFEIIVSNPPYVPEHDRDSLAVEVRQYEPALALFAGEDGLAVYRRLIPDAFAALVPGGFVVLEIGYGQETLVRSFLGAAGFETIEFTADLQGIPRVASARRA
jgi:release factor glutamine methyltransferase